MTKREVKNAIKPNRKDSLGQHKILSESSIASNEKTRDILHGVENNIPGKEKNISHLDIEGEILR